MYIRHRCVWPVGRRSCCREPFASRQGILRERQGVLTPQAGKGSSEAGSTFRSSVGSLENGTVLSDSGGILRIAGVGHPKVTGGCPSDAYVWGFQRRRSGTCTVAGEGPLKRRFGALRYTGLWPSQICVGPLELLS